MTSQPERPPARDWLERLGAVMDETLALIATLYIVLASGGAPLFTGRWYYIGYPLAALYAAIAVGRELLPLPQMALQEAGATLRRGASRRLPSARRARLKPPASGWAGTRGGGALRA
jgi:hypothetical protein